MPFHASLQLTVDRNLCTPSGAGQENMNQATVRNAARLEWRLFHVDNSRQREGPAFLLVWPTPKPKPVSSFSRPRPVPLECQRRKEISISAPGARPLPPTNLILLAALCPSDRQGLLLRVSTKAAMCPSCQPTELSSADNNLHWNANASFNLSLLWSTVGGELWRAKANYSCGVATTRGCR